MPRDPHQVDWAHYAANKERLDADAKKVLEAGTLQSFGHPPGPTLEISAKAMVTILDKHPELAHGTVKPNGKPLTASEKRKQRRFEKNRPPDEVIEETLEEGKGFKIIKNEEYIKPPRAPYIKDGVEMPPDWEPISLQDCQPTAVSPCA